MSTLVYFGLAKNNGTASNMHESSPLNTRSRSSSNATHCDLVNVHLGYREVTKARERKTGRLVALKKVKMEKEKEGVSVKIHVF